jgi:hypothetical protein
MAKYYFRFVLLVGAVTGVLIGIFALLGSLLPRSYDFTCEIDIAAPPEEIFEQIDQLRNWPSWTNWNPGEIEGLTVQCAGESGVGCAMSWTDSRGSGKLWIVESVPPQSMTYLMRFHHFPEMTSEFRLAPLSPKLSGSEPAPTRVKWTSRGSLPSGPFYGYWASQFSIQMQAQYQRSLEKLKAKLEKSEPR